MREKRYEIRLTDEEAAEYRTAAKELGLPLAAWMRLRLTEAVKGLALPVGDVGAAKVEVLGVWASDPKRLKEFRSRYNRDPRGQTEWEAFIKKGY